MPRHRDNERALFRLADAQQGLFTLKQAEEVGFSPTNATYHVNAGNWIRQTRGIYRLAQYPESSQTELVTWSLWSNDRRQIPQGVYSHETALQVHELTDLLPSRLHLTVPPTFRRTADPPKILVLHRARLSPEQILPLRGFSVTKPLRTIQDLIKSETVQLDVLRQALENSLRRGILNAKDLRENDLAELEHLMRTIS